MPTPTNGTQHAAPETETATLAGGCFWCLDAAYRQLRGVSDVVSGYTGGHVANPSYEQVCSGRTGHAEAVQITYDPRQITYRDLLDVFFTIHDPTTLNRQDHDVGTQYRSAIFYQSPEQQQIAQAAIDAVNQAGTWGKPVVTQLVPLEAFYRAEDYHQDYFTNNPYQPYCQVVVAPKVAKVRHTYLERLKRA